MKISPHARRQLEDALAGKTGGLEEGSVQSGAKISQGQGEGTWIRLPRSGERCPWSGLSRSALNELILGEDPEVESIVVAKKGKRRGIRLVRLSSLLAFFDRVAKEQKAERGEESDL